MRLIFNIVDNCDIIATILIPEVKDNWQIIDFCNKFYTYWKKGESELFERNSFEILSHDLRLRALKCCELCGGYQTVLDDEFMNAEFPKIKKVYKKSVSQNAPCIILNPSLIKETTSDERDARVSFSFADKDFYFFNVIKECNTLEELNLYLPSSLTQNDIVECPYNFKNSAISAQEISKFNDWIYYDLNGFDLDDVSGEDTWVFKGKDKKYYKLS